MKQLKNFISVNKWKWVNYFTRKFGCSKGFYYKLLRKLKTWEWIINPNKLARIYNRLGFERDSFFKQVLKEYYKDTGNTIRKVRIKRGWTLTELAQLTNLNLKTIVAVENNKQAKSHYTIDCILQVLNLHWK